jgi:hypothetical protein
MKNNTVAQLRSQIFKIADNLDSFDKKTDGTIAFRRSSEEDINLKPIINALLMTIDEVNSVLASGEGTDSLLSNSELAEDEKGLWTSILKLIKPTKIESFSNFLEFCEINTVPAGFKEAVSKTNAELLVYQYAFKYQYKGAFINLSPSEQEAMMIEKSIMFPGRAGLKAGLPDGLFVGATNQLIYLAAANQGIEATASFEENQLVRHPLDIFLNMSRCFGDENSEYDYKNHHWSVDNINKFREYAYGENWVAVQIAKESIKGSKNLETLMGDAYQVDFKMESYHILA